MHDKRKGIGLGFVLAMAAIVAVIVITSKAEPHLNQAAHELRTVSTQLTQTDQTISQEKSKVEKAISEAEQDEKALGCEQKRGVQVEEAEDNPYGPTFRCLSESTAHEVGVKIIKP